MESACRAKLCSRKTPSHLKHGRALVVVLLVVVTTQALCLCLETNNQRNLPISLTPSSKAVTGSQETARRVSSAKRVCLTSFGVSNETASVSQVLLDCAPGLP
eukprot:6184331-Pleurochrysis_carterae.AAC.2